MFVKERFVLDEYQQDYLRSLIPPFGYNGFGEFIYYRTYSRIKKDGSQENWADTVIRVVNGTFSIRKDWYKKNRITWDEHFWQEYAKRFSEFLFMMKWMPPGRGLWAMGTDFVYQRGSMSLNNCAYIRIESSSIAEDIAWIMDALMQGVGVGFRPVPDSNFRLHKPCGTFEYVIPDSREGWCIATKYLIEAYTKPNKKLPRFIYDKIRGPGLPIRGFGGISSGPAPLIEFHQNIIKEFELFGTRSEYNATYLKANLANRSGVCVIAGNTRRSAEIAIGNFSDPVFKDLKNYQKFPERELYGWMSNNSVELETQEDFNQLGEIAKRVIVNGEPGYINRKNMRHGRIGKFDDVKEDKADGFNPCGEIPLESKELCNLSETLPTMCVSNEEWLEACEYATLYSSTVSLLPTNQPDTNKIIARNRRIGVGIIDYVGWKKRDGVYNVTKSLRLGYQKVREINKKVNEEAGVPISIRVTCIKPGGTVPKLPGRTSGIGHPNFTYMIRRVRLLKTSPVHDILVKANVPFEDDIFNKDIAIFSWPLYTGDVKPAEEVTLWEQAMNLILMQREWSDNSTSNTLNFRPKWQLIEVGQEHQDLILLAATYIGHVEACNFIELGEQTEYLVPERYKLQLKRDQYGSPLELKIYEYDHKHEEEDIEPVLSAIAPLTKSVSLLPHTAKGVYQQMPEEGISEKEYHKRLSQIKKIDWSRLSGSDGQDELYCTKDSCEIIQK